MRAPSALLAAIALLTPTGCCCLTTAPQASLLDRVCKVPVCRSCTTPQPASVAAQPAAVAAPPVVGTPVAAVTAPIPTPVPAPPVAAPFNTTALGNAFPAPRQVVGGTPITQPFLMQVPAAPADPPQGFFHRLFGHNLFHPGR